MKRIIFLCISVYKKITVPIWPKLKNFFFNVKVISLLIATVPAHKFALFVQSISHIFSFCLKWTVCSNSDLSCPQRHKFGLIYQDKIGFAPGVDNTRLHLQEMELFLFTLLNKRLSEMGTMLISIFVFHFLNFTCYIELFAVF